MILKPQSQPKKPTKATMCAECGNNRALFKIKNRGKVRADKWHDLCFKCSRAHINRNREEPSLWQ
jgi:hypothetical protein